MPLILALLSLLLVAGATPTSTFSIWPHQVPGQNESKAPHVIVKKPHGLRIGKVTNPTLDVYEPTKPNGIGLIICPGGGYVHLADKKEGHDVAEHYRKLGYTCFVLTYRIPRNQQGALQDAQRSLRFVRANTAKWQLSHIGIMGFSAGGSLSARLATQFENPLYPEQDERDVVSARPDFVGLIYPAYLDQGPGKSLTPELTLSENTPPMFLYVAADDSFANSTIVMTQALAQQKIPYETHILPKGGHGFGMLPGKRASETWPALLHHWIQETCQK